MASGGDGRDGNTYHRHRKRAGEAQSESSRQGREIGSLPKVLNAARKKAARESFRNFCETYLAEKFSLGWSDDHLIAIQRIEDAVLRGGLFALAMPRGSGKTTLTEAAVLWCGVYGHRRFTVLIGADVDHASGMLANIKIELETNDPLLEDFPEVCYPIRALEGIANRCKGQLHDGQRTYPVWSAAEIVLPTIAGSAASGCRVRARGITGRIRGMKVTLADGSPLRPSLVVIDDPQTEESAGSKIQIKKRMNVLTGAILGLAGPGQRIAGIMPCTVISPGDMADQILDREKYPQWNGLRTQLVYEWPKAEALWQKYAQVRAESLRAGNDGREATQFYKNNRVAMDDGAKVAWPARYAEGELSAMQHAWNLRLDLGEEAFFAEYQNAPKRQTTAKIALTPEIVVAKVNGLPRGVAPKTAQHASAYIDVHGRLLYYVATAWEGDFGGDVMDYGTYPEQPLPYFAQQTAPVSMADVHPGMAEDAYIQAALTALVDRLLARAFAREDGAVMRIEKLLIDAKWGEKTELVKAFCRRHPQAIRIVLPAMGVGLGPTKKALMDYRPEPGAETGFHCRIPPPVKGDRVVMIDTNRLKSFAASRLALAVGTPGGWELWGRDPYAHRLFADHCAAERPRELKATDTNVIVDQWEWLVGQDNHLWDCLVGSAAAASLVGVRPAGIEITGRRRPPSERPTAGDLARRRSA